MIMADVLKIFLIVLGALIVTVSYWLAAEALFPRLVGRAMEAYRVHPLRNVLLGVLLGAPLAAGGFKLLQAGSAPIKAAGFLLAAVAVFGGLLGSAGLCRRIGAGLPSPADAAQPWRRVLRGSVVLSLMFLLPFLGWFLVMPLVLSSGIGATMAAGLGRRQEASAPRVRQRPEGVLT